MASLAGSMFYLRIWTRQCCVGCGTLYQFLTRYAVPARSVAADETIAGVEAHFARIARDRYCPCPRCGFVQPNMIAARQNADSFLIGLGGAVLLALLFVLNLSGGRGPVQALIAGNAFVFAVASVLLLRATFKSRNRAAADEQRLLATELERGRVRILDERKGTRDVVLPATGGKRALAVLVLASGVLVCLLPLAVPALPIWLTQLTALALLVGAVWLFAKAVAPWKDAGVEVATEVSTHGDESGNIPNDFRDFVKEPGRYHSHWPLK